MTPKETAQILGIVAIAYQNFVLDKPKISVWHELIGDLDFNLAQMAVKKLISESPYPPTVHDIRRRAAEIIQPQLPDAAEAWGIVKANIRKYGRYHVTEGIEALPEPVKTTVRYFGYIELCEGDPDIIRAQFMRMYDQVANRLKNEQLLPLPLREQIKALAGQLALEGGHDENKNNAERRRDNIHLGDHLPVGDGRRD